MARAALFEFSISSAAEIVSAIIDEKITTIQNLHAFRTRMGGAKKADRLYPATREALNIIKTLRQQAKDAKTIRNILSPYSNELAKGRDVLEIVQPVLTAYRLYYASHGIGLMNDQVLLLKMLEAGGELEAITGKAIPDLTTSA